MIDCGITGGQWVTLPQSTYCEEQRHKKLTHCQYELHTHFSSIQSHPPEGRGSHLSSSKGSIPLLPIFDAEEQYAAIARCTCQEMYVLLVMKEIHSFLVMRSIFKDKVTFGLGQ